MASWTPEQGGVTSNSWLLRGTPTQGWCPGCQRNSVVRKYDWYYADPAYAEEKLGWKASRTVGEMTADTWHWQSDNPNGYA